MPLPSLNEEVSFHKVPLPSGKSLGIKPWKVKHEKELLFATEGSDDREFVLNEMLGFLRKNVQDVQLFDSLSETDLMVVGSEMRKMSKGASVEYSFKCSHCGYQNEDVVNLNEDVIVKKFDGTPHKIRENLVVTFKEVPQSIRAGIEKSTEKLTEYNWYFLVNSIESITKDGVSYTTFTIAEMEEFIDELSSAELAELFKVLLERGADVKIQAEPTCLKCNKTNSVVFTDPLGFFVL